MSLADVAPDATDDESALEAFDTFEENALAKARYFAERFPAYLVLADDSGLEVDALGGRPGVHSKRWSERNDLDGQALDDANNAKLLDALARVGALTEHERQARYVCVMAAVLGSALERTARGTCNGHILLEPVGRGGFGYDPLFYSTDLGRSFGDVTREEKARVSHRARAARQLVPLLPRWD